MRTRSRGKRGNGDGRKRIDRTRRRRGTTPSLPDALEGKAKLPESQPESTLSRVRRLVGRLPVRYRDFIDLDLVQGLSLEEICEELGLDRATCLVLKRLAFDALRRALLEDPNP
jgi:DNA-directed RNA polymerase specialized sigma24 family protein